MLEGKRDELWLENLDCAFLLVARGLGATLRAAVEGRSDCLTDPELVDLFMQYLGRCSPR